MADHLHPPVEVAEEHPAFEGALTARLSRRVVADAKVMTFSAAARRHGVHWHAVRALVDTWSALVAERRRSRRCAVLLVDETSMRKRHRYVTVIVNGDTGRTLAMVEHRSSAALSAFLMQQGHRWCKGVKVVVSDGSKAYKSAIDAHLGHARHVLDRFHVIRWFAAGLTQVRRDAQRPISHRLPPDSKPLMPVLRYADSPLCGIIPMLVLSVIGNILALRVFVGLRVAGTGWVIMSRGCRGLRSCVGW